MNDLKNKNYINELTKSYSDNAYVTFGEPYKKIFETLRYVEAPNSSLKYLLIIQNNSYSQVYFQTA